MHLLNARDVPSDGMLKHHRRLAQPLVELGLVAIGIAPCGFEGFMRFKEVPLVEQADAIEKALPLLIHRGALIPRRFGR